MRGALRAATQCLHDRIERIWSPNGAFETRSTYLDFLRMLLRTHETLGLAAANARGQDTEISDEAARINALRLDLGQGPEVLRPTGSLAEDYAWGVAYVLNGSALGATMLLKHDRLGPEWPREYLRLGQAYVQSGHLKRFFDALNTGPHDPAQVLRGARDTFARLEPSVEDIH